MLEGMDAKAQPILALLSKGLGEEGVQGRGPGPGIQFRLDGRNPQAGQGESFPPAREGSNLVGRARGLSEGRSHAG